MDVKTLIEKAKTIEDCIVYPPKGIPKVEDNNILPEDIREFYSQCGGMELYTHTDGFSYRILPPEKFLLANPLILGEELAKEISTAPEYINDITLNCYTIVEDMNGDYLVVDIHKNRSGLCYDAFHETYGLVGEMPIIGRSFIELLKCLIENKGKNIYWLKDDFIPIGDAYDNAK